MYAAYQATPLDLKQKISSLQAVHKYQSRRNMSKVPKLTIDELNMTPDVIHPLIRTHPISKEKSVKMLYVFLVDTGTMIQVRQKIQNADYF